jgi:hypothetical protein
VVDSSNHAETTATDMGNGHWPYEGWQNCTYMSHLYYQSSTGGALSRYNPSSVYATNSLCYDIEGHFDNTGGWGPYFGGVAAGATAAARRPRPRLPHTDEGAPLLLTLAVFEAEVGPLETGPVL